MNELGKQQDHIEKKTRVGRSRSNSSTQSTDSHKYPTTNPMLNTPCYVPGGELLPILIRNDHNINTNTNGDAYNNQTVPLYDTETTPQPEMCDSACQTRESLFTQHGIGSYVISSEHSTPNHSITSQHSKPSPPAPFSTFGYKKETSNNTTSKYRAEAKIEMEKIDGSVNNKPQYEDKRRPYSVQTTKSAPDVIVTH